MMGCGKTRSAIKANRFALLTPSLLTSAFSTGTTKTHSNVPLGPAHANRVLFVISYWQSDASSGYTEVNIDGTPMTVGRTVNDSFTGAGIHFLAWPAGSTATINVVLTGAGNKNGDIIVGAMHTTSLSLTSSESAGGSTTTGAISHTSTTAGKLTLWGNGCQGFSPATTMAMTIQHGISVVYNPSSTQGVWAACVQPAEAVGGTVTFTPNWTPDTTYSDGSAVSCHFTHS